MLKTIFLAATLAAAALPATIHAASPDTQSFVHDGLTYVYTQEQRGNYRILRGTITPTGEKFTLRIYDKWVRGDINGRDVSFAVAKVKSPAPATVIASD